MTTMPSAPRVLSLDRRTLLQCASLGGLASLSPMVGHADVPVSPAMQRLSTYMADAGSTALPDAIVEQTKLHVLDTVAAMVSGSSLLPGKLGTAFARSYGGRDVGTIVGSNVTCGPVEAGFANGMLAQADETDDSDDVVSFHPGCSTVPATLAAGEQFDIDGSRFLRAVTLGYDVGSRVTETLGVNAFGTIGHKSTHAVGGTFASAAAAGCAADLDAQKMRWLLDYTAQQSSGILAWQRSPDHVEKSFVFAAMPARNGVTGALLVSQGWVGIDDIFSGPDNFLAAYAPGANPDGLTDRLGQRFEITLTAIKKWTVGEPIQAPLDGLDTLMSKYRFKAENVRKVVVRLAPADAKTVNGRTTPDIDLQYAVAVMLSDGTVSFTASDDAGRMNDPAMLQQRAKVDLVADEGLQKMVPAPATIVEVTLADGRQLSERVMAVRGTSGNPMTRDDVAAKARGLIVPVLGSDQGSALINRLLALEQVRSIRELRPLLQASR